MRIEQPSFKIWPQEEGINGVYKQIERAGRVCYKSEKNASEDSAKPFVERMIAADHTAMLEHGTVYLKGAVENLVNRYANNRFSRIHVKDGVAYVTTNLRVVAENKWMEDLECFCEPTSHHEQRITVHFTTQVGVTREFNRHRANSMAEQSTRYCNYSKDKFGGEIAINLPEWIKKEADCQKIYQGLNHNLLKQLCQELVIEKDQQAWSAVDNWLFANLACEYAYLNLISLGRKPQEARVVLPLDINTELVHTAFVSDWKHFFDLRALGTTGAPHPDAKAIAAPLFEEFKRLKFL